MEIKKISPNEFIVGDVVEAHDKSDKYIILSITETWIHRHKGYEVLYLSDEYPETHNVLVSEILENGPTRRVLRTSEM